MKSGGEEVERNMAVLDEEALLILARNLVNLMGRWTKDSDVRYSDFGRYSLIPTGVYGSGISVDPETVTDTGVQDLGQLCSRNQITMSVAFSTPGVSKYELATSALTKVIQENSYIPPTSSLTSSSAITTTLFSSPTLTTKPGTFVKSTLSSTVFHSPTAEASPGAPT